MLVCHADYYLKWYGIYEKTCWLFDNYNTSMALTELFLLFHNKHIQISSWHTQTYKHFEKPVCVAYYDIMCLESAYDIIHNTIPICK